MIIFPTESPQVKDEDIVRGKKGCKLRIEDSRNFAKRLNGRIFSAGFNLGNRRLAQFRILG
ncbi:MAG: hypothetical protein AAB425_08080 [Bdellovibrionota bacterium]